MNRRQFRSFVFLLLLALFGAGCSFFNPRQPSVVILSPTLGTQFRAGETVAIQVIATDASGIARVDLYVDGMVVQSNAPTSPQQSFNVTLTWQAAEGAHAITVRAVNASGASSDPATVQVAVEGAGAPAAAPTSIALGETPTPFFAPPTNGSCTDDAAFIADVTIPDGTVLAPRQAFGKVWRVRNTGSCAWGQGYQFTLVSGAVLLGPTSVSVPSVAPGATADLAVTMTAPERSGTFTSMWRLRNSAGTLFGVTVTLTIRVTGGISNAPCSRTPNIESFAVSPTTINAGQDATLSWGRVTNADTAEIDNGIGGIATPGNTSLRPTETTTYTLTAFCGMTASRRQVTVQVIPAPTVPPPTASPTATPIPPTPTLVPPTAAPSPSATASNSLTRCYNPDASGEAVKAGAGRVSSPLVQFGDDNTNSTHRALLTFDIRDLAGKTIDSAALSINTYATLGSPFGLGTVIVETVSYSPPVTGSDYGIDGTNLLRIASGLTGRFDIKSSLSDAASARQPRYQVRFRFADDTNRDNVTDTVFWTNANDVCLIVTAR